MIAKNQCERPGRLHRGSRAEIIWQDADIAAFFSAAPPHVALPFAIALETGQCQGDILRMTWAQYDGTSIKLRQSKTGKRLVVTVTKSLRARIDAIKDDGQNVVTICLTSRGQP